jgi:acid phosphatase class B
MKLLLENWRKYLSEEDNLEQNIYSFDFDNTLIRYHTLEDGDVVYLGPHEENIQLVKDLAADGNKIIIVTSRSKRKGPKHPWDDGPTPEEAIEEFGLPVEEVYYTFGDFKADKLLELGVSKHWDDDDEEVAAAEEAGIESVLVPVEEGITDRLRNKWADHNEEMKKAHETTN